jgi:F-type H+-transporting ATPase subunit c
LLLFPKKQAFSFFLSGTSPMNWLALVSIFSAAMAVSFGAIGPAFGEGRAVAAAMDAIARQPESASTISRTLFVGLAMIETMAIYCLVIALLLLFANPLLK